MNVYAPKNRDPKYLKQKLNRIERKKWTIKKNSKWKFQYSTPIIDIANNSTENKQGYRRLNITNQYCLTDIITHFIQ